MLMNDLEEEQCDSDIDEPHNFMDSFLSTSDIDAKSNVEGTGKTTRAAYETGTELIELSEVRQTTPTPADEPAHADERSAETWETRPPSRTLKSVCFKLTPQGPSERSLILSNSTASQGMESVIVDDVVRALHTLNAASKSLGLGEAFEETTYQAHPETIQSVVSALQLSHGDRFALCQPDVSSQGAAWCGSGRACETGVQTESARGRLNKGVLTEDTSHSLGIFSANNLFRIRVQKLLAWRKFDQIMLVMIVISNGTLAATDPLQDKFSERNHVLTKMDNLLNLFFAAEFLLKAIAMGLLLEPDSYLRDYWNILDFICLISSLTDAVSNSFGTFKVIRFLRLLRPFRAIRGFPKLELLFLTVAKSMPLLGNVAFLVFVLLFFFGVMGIEMFQAHVPRRRGKAEQGDRGAAGSAHGLPSPRVLGRV
ncbi:hypothetical protein CYMTET_30848 [Cymbomonas tetramitiformis]|uniref:Ion transport domain-containing protein n=1 Tax=Cymbomonas tetramitiformis TaxID=36881 RepID=A0AAE0KTQ5_9CHLO|nr:hypothetical protein CYMTET_30848 [Cymbomonas tetramitiformis]